MKNFASQIDHLVDSIAAHRNPVRLLTLVGQS